MEAIFRLVENTGLRAVNNLSSHFVSTVRRQAVQKDGVILGAGHSLSVDLIWQERGPAILAVILLAH